MKKPYKPLKTLFRQHTNAKVLICPPCLNGWILKLTGGYISKLMKKVEIFKTSVCKYTEAENLVHVLLLKFPHYKINFDLDDCDRILRIETVNYDIDKN